MFFFEEQREMAEIHCHFYPNAWKHYIVVHTESLYVKESDWWMMTIFQQILILGVFQPIWLDQTLVDALKYKQ